MREILFRGKRKDDKQWVFGDLEHNGNRVPKWVDGQVIDQSTIGQFTGLTDKNGQKVFEGDMVVSYDLFGSVDACGIVNWNDLFCAWHIGKNSMYGNRIATYEVIGNIHDSHEPHTVKMVIPEE